MSTQTGTYYLGTFGWPIAVTLGSDLAGATAVELFLTKPDGTSVTRALTTGAITDSNAGIVTFNPTSAEVSLAGVYAFEVRVAFGGSKTLVTAGQFTISETLTTGAATLVLETGAGISNANSYVSRTFANSYNAGRLYSTSWSDATGLDKDRALISATRLIDADMRWNGRRATTTQVLDWPRYGIRNDDYRDDYGPRGPGWGIILSNYYFAEDIIPQRLKEATSIMAMELLRADRTIENSAKGVSSLSLGQGAIALTFSKDDRPMPLSESVLRLLAKYGWPRYAGAQSVRTSRVM